MRRPNRCSGPLDRRDFLRVGSFALGGLALSDLLRLRAAATEQECPVADTSVILLWLSGGPSQLETYDLKPDAPAEYRGEFRPIRTVVSGLDVCEHLPLHAKSADKFTLIRSIQPNYQDHGPGTWRFLSGRMQPISASDGPSHFPEIGSIVSWARRAQRTALPQFIAQPRIFRQGHAYLGLGHAPFLIGADPAAADFRGVNLTLHPALAGRLEDRQRLLRGFDTLRREVDTSGTMAVMDEFNRQAVHLLTGDEARRAFDLNLESTRVRERYGRHSWGQSALLARRLAEAGCGFVQMNLLSIYKNGYFNGFADNWDDHSEAVRGNIFEAMRRRLPVLDQTVTALIEDIYQRGLEKKIMVIVTGEFGRTPRINTASGRPGRDHWGGSMSVLVSGGGLKTGQVIGATNARAEYPHSGRLDPNDLLATIYRFLGIDTEAPIPDATGRPMPILPYGTPIAELL
jgi:hypothetical protein